MMTYGESPAKDHVAPDWRDKIIHARLTVGERVLMGGDAPPPNYKRPEGISVSLGIEGYAEAQRVFTALAAGGAVTMPFQRTFWSPGFGMVVDRFGTPWMVNCAEASSGTLASA